MNIFPGFGTKDAPLDGKAFTAAEWDLFQGRPTDSVKGGTGFINDLNASQGVQRVREFRANPVAPTPPTAPPASKVEAKAEALTTPPVSSRGGSVKRERASKGATATKARSILSNKSSDTTLG